MRFRDAAALADTLHTITNTRPRLASLSSIGKSFEGRDLWLLTIGHAEPGKPAILVDAAEDGTELVAAEVALRAIGHVMDGVQPDSLIDLLSRVTLYVLPRANPDAVERAFREPGRLQATIPRPRDDDRDERIDEDGPEDIDGDGVVTWMRVADPAGEWTADPVEPRLLVKRKPSDPGPFYRRYAEGIDNDDDGLVNEDPEGGVALLHNFPQGWEMEIVQPGAGPYAASEPETVAMLEFVVSHPEIAAVLTLSQDERPERPGVGTPGYMPDADGDVYAALDDLMKSIRGRGLVADQESAGDAGIGGAGQLVKPGPGRGPGTMAPRAVVPGSFLEWTYFQTGAFALSPRVWVDAPAFEGSDADTTGGRETDGKPRDARAAAWLKWADIHRPDALVEWTPFRHPTLSDVEIGGLATMRIAPAPAELDSLAAEVADLILALGARMPHLIIDDLETEPMSDGLYRVRTTIVNAGRLPTMSARGADAGIYHPVLAEIDLPPGATLVDTPQRVKLGRLGPGERRTAEWLVAGSPGLSVDVRTWSVRAGSSARTVALGSRGSR